MKLFVIGATGNVGAHLVDLGLERGHHLTVFVRSPRKVRRTHERLRVVQGNPLDAEELAAALHDHDAVFTALGTKPPAAFFAHTVVRDGMTSLVRAVQRSGPTRIVLVSAAVLFPMRGALFAFFRWLLTHIRHDLGAAEHTLRASGLRWTIARPPRLVQSKEVRYRERVDALPDDGRSMSFRAVAAFLLDAAERGVHVHEVVGLAGPRG